MFGTTFSFWNIITFLRSYISKLPTKSYSFNPKPSSPKITNNLVITLLAVTRNFSFALEKFGFFNNSSNSYNSSLETYFHFLRQNPKLHF